MIKSHFCLLNLQSIREQLKRKQTQCQLTRTLIETTSREKTEHIGALNRLKQQIHDIEIRQNEAVNEVSELFLKSYYALCYKLKSVALSF